MICILLKCAIANNLDQPSRSLQLFLSENKCSLLFQSLIASPGDLMKGNIARDLECPLEVISGTTNVCISKIQHNVRSQLHVQWSDVLCKHLFLVTFDWKDLYDAEHDLLAVAEFLVPLHTVRII